MRVINRNTLILFFGQLVFVSSSMMTVTMSGIVGARLTPDPMLATLPASLVFIGTAAGTIPATVVMHRIGRSWGFSSAAIVASASMLLVVGALYQRSFVLYCAATTVMGLAGAFSNQFRFAAAESVGPDKAALAISFILMGSIGAAFLGPGLVSGGASINTENSFVGAVTGAGILLLIAAFALSHLSLSPAGNPKSVKHEYKSRTALQLLMEPLFFLSLLAGVVGQGIMIFVTTATPVSMHVINGHSLADTAAVIRILVLAMYVPSLVSGLVIRRVGERNIMFVGVLAYVAVLILGLSGNDVQDYKLTVLSLGIGWNCLFVGGTTLLVQTYHPHERATAQGLNEGLVFGTSAVGSLLAGTLLVSVGWDMLLYSLIPVLVFTAGAILVLRKCSLPEHG